MANLLWITERFPPDLGGVARSSSRIVRSLIRLGVTVDVVTWSRYLQGGEILPPEQSGLLRVHRLGLYRHWDMTLPQTLNFLDWLHHHQSFDAVWGHYLFPAGFVAVWFAQLNGLTSVVSARGNDMDRGLFPPGDFARLQWTLTQASHLTAVSQDMATKIKTLCQRPATVLPNSVDLSIFHPKTSTSLSSSATLRETLGIAPEEIILGFSGELREKKGQQFLLQALLEVRAVRPACLLIIGELRPESHTLLQHCAETYPDAVNRIIVTGSLVDPRQVADHLRLCDLYLQPSLWEGMPNGLLEAMACGCPCIGSDAGGIPEVIEHGVTGFLLPRSQLHHLGKTVLEYLALEPSMQHTIQQCAQAFIQLHHSLDHEQTQLTHLLTQMLPHSSTH